MFYVKINVDNVMFDKKGKLKFVFLFLVLFAAPFFANAFLPKLDLIKGSGPEVYLLEKGTRHWIPSPGIFTGNGFGWKYIISVDDDVLDDFDEGEIPDYSSNYEVSVDNTCVAFLNEQFNYAYCYNDHYLEVDFFGDEWRVFLGKSIDILNNVSDKVILRDGNGLVVWEYEY